MNRRSLFKMLPALPLAVLPSTVEAKTVPSNMLSFKLKDYRLWVHGQTAACEKCGDTHLVYTHGCVPVAFPLDLLFGTKSKILPATSDAIPLPVHMNCELGHSDSRAEREPHQHHNFVWV